MAKSEPHQAKTKLRWQEVAYYIASAWWVLCGVITLISPARIIDPYLGQIVTIVDPTR